MSSCSTYFFLFPPFLVLLFLNAFPSSVRSVVGCFALRTQHIGNKVVKVLSRKEIYFTTFYSDANQPNGKLTATDTSMSRQPMFRQKSILTAITQTTIMLTCMLQHLMMLSNMPFNSMPNAECRFYICNRFEKKIEFGGAEEIFLFDRTKRGAKEKTPF